MSNKAVSHSRLPQIATHDSQTLPPLPYAYNALEPYIIEEIMVLHHQKHHQTYVNNFNSASEAILTVTNAEERAPLESAIKFNGGGTPFPVSVVVRLSNLLLGHINHSLFWENLAPSATNSSDSSNVGGVLRPGPLATAIDQDFGSLEEMKKKFNAATLGIQGSGWGWLVLKNDGHLAITTTPNQDPVTGQSRVPNLVMYSQSH
jgi:Fe-Mn family superoxide dismutase